MFPVWIVLVIKKENQNNNKHTKKNQGKNKSEIGIIVPTNNYYPRNG